MEHGDPLFDSRNGAGIDFAIWLGFIMAGLEVPAFVAISGEAWNHNLPMKTRYRLT